MRARTMLSFAAVFLIVLAMGCAGSGSGEKKDALAKCLTEKGAKMYGAYWCQHCNNQKADFGSSFQYVDYVECDPAGTNPKPQECKDAGINGYPTWVIDGAQYPGEQELATLAKLSGCAY